MALTLPTRWKPYLYAGNAATYDMDGSTIAAPRRVSLRRKEPQQTNKPMLAVSEMALKYQEAIVVADEGTIPTKDSIELIVRRGVSSSGVNLKADLSELATLLASPDFVNNLVDSQYIPVNTGV